MSDADPSAPVGPPPVPGLEIFDAPEEAPASPAADVPATGEPRLAHPALRAVAFVGDGVGTFAVTVLAVFLLLDTDYRQAFSAILLVPALSALLSTVLTAIYGVTPAKALLGLRVVDAETGGRLGWRAIPRSLVIVAPLVLTYVLAATLDALADAVDTSAAVILFLPVAGWIALLAVLSASRDHRGLQDRAARSVVVVRERPARDPEIR